MNWSGKKVLVTGAGGFIGSHLSEELVKRGADTYGFVHYNSQGNHGWLDKSDLRNDIEIISGDITNIESVLQAMSGIDIVFHLAALVAIPYSLIAPRSYILTNVHGTLNVLEAAKKLHTETLIHTSSSEVYGTANYVPIDEAHPLQGQSPYSASKIGADKMVEAYHYSYGLPVTTIRPFNTFGPRQLSRAVVPSIISQALTQDKIHLGNLSPTRDFNYVSDTVEGFIKIAECKSAIGKAFNIGSGREIAIGDIAHMICGLLGYPDMRITHDPQRVRPEGGEVERLCCQSNFAKKTFGWAPKYTLEQGLEQTITWIKSNLDQYRLGTYEI
ncbi:MAG: NAD-dependent dehydratase [Chloroflexi bacterium]|nr:NAD-dependent dehydratase [Chloroflexota bacterium]